MQPCFFRSVPILTCQKMPTRGLKGVCDLFKSSGDGGSHLGVASRGTSGLDMLLRSPCHPSNSSLSIRSPRDAGVNLVPVGDKGSAREGRFGPGVPRWALRTVPRSESKRRARE